MAIVRCILVIVICSIGYLDASSQRYASVTIEQDYQLLTERFSELANTLASYDGMGEFCAEPDFRAETISILSYLHHYDSLVLQLMLDPTSGMDISHREFKKTMADIQKFEDDYSVEAFVDVLKESCLARNAMEKDADDLRKESGVYSYDGQKLILETKLAKYMKHLVKRLVAIEEHIHLIHPDQLQNVRILAENL
ncbi:MAG: hypothetical protein RIC35_08550 [Marinoscillum sp.]